MLMIEYLVVVEYHSCLLVMYHEYVYNSAHRSCCINKFVQAVLIFFSCEMARCSTVSF